MGPLAPLALALLAQVSGPRALDFEVRLRSCEGLAAVGGIGNPSDRPVRVDAARVEGVPGLELLSAPTFPRVLQPGERLTVGLGFMGADLGPFSGALVFDTEAGPFRTRLGGELAAIVEDRHRAPAVEQVDLLFVVDDAPSMADEQRAMQFNFQAFAQYVRAQGLDAHLAVTTPDATAFRRLPDGAAFLRSSDPELERRFAELIEVGVAGPGERRGIRAALDGLQTADAHTPGFLRPDAVLSIIVVADADDRSSMPVPEAFEQFADFKGFWNPNRLSISTIAPDDPGGCSGFGGTGTAAPRYIELAERTGGVFQSICTADWSRSLEDLSTAAFGFKSRYRLSRRPSSSNIEVFVNGEAIPGVSATGTVNWVYSQGVNAIDFSPFSAPEPSADILFRYRPGCRFARTTTGVPR